MLGDNSKYEQKEIDSSKVSDTLSAKSATNNLDKSIRSKNCEDLRIAENDQIIRKNLKNVVKESLEHSMKMLSSTFGHLLNNLQEIHNIKIPGDIALMSNKLITQLQFIFLLNFRRVLNTINGVSEDFLDNIVLFKQEYPKLDYLKGLTVSDLINSGMQNNYLNRVYVTPEQYAYMEELTLSSFIEFMDEHRTDLFLVDYDEENISGQANSKLKVSKQRLLEGVMKHKHALDKIAKKEGEIYQLKKKIEEKDQEIKILKNKIISGVGMGRRGGTIGLFNTNLNPRDDIKLDFDHSLFDSNVIVYFQAKINDIAYQYNSKIDKLSQDLKSTKSRLQKYLDMDDEESPAFSTILIKRGFEGMKNNKHMLWKVLQDLIGNNWFYDVFLNRGGKAKQLEIDYSTIDGILCPHFTHVLKENPEKLNFLDFPNGEFLAEIISSFKAQEEVLVEEIERLNKIVLSQQNADNAIANQTPKTIPDNIGNPELRHALEQVVDINVQNSRNQHREIEDIKKENIHLKATEHMLINELVNLQSQIISLNCAFTSSEKRYMILGNFIKKILIKVGEKVEGQSIGRGILKVRNLDSRVLKGFEVDGLIRNGSLEVLSKLAITSSITKKRPNKSTSTDTNDYQDLAKDSELVLAVTTRVMASKYNLIKQIADSKKGANNSLTQQGADKVNRDSPMKRKTTNEFMDESSPQSNELMKLNKSLLFSPSPRVQRISEINSISENPEIEDRSSPRLKISLMRTEMLNSEEEVDNLYNNNADSKDRKKEKRRRALRSKQSLSFRAPKFSSGVNSHQQRVNHGRTKFISSNKQQNKETRHLSKHPQKEAIEVDLQREPKVRIGGYRNKILKPNLPLSEEIDYQRGADFLSTNQQILIREDPVPYTPTTERERLKIQRGGRLKIKAMNSILIIPNKKTGKFEVQRFKAERIRRSIDLSSKNLSVTSQLESSEDLIIKSAKDWRLNDKIMWNIRRIDDNNPEMLVMKNLDFDEEFNAIQKLIHKPQNNSIISERDKILQRQGKKLEKKMREGGSRKIKKEKELREYVFNQLSLTITNSFRANIQTPSEGGYTKKKESRALNRSERPNTTNNQMRVSAATDSEIQLNERTSFLKRRLRSLTTKETKIEDRLIKKKEIQDQIINETRAHFQKKETAEWTLRLLDKGMIMCMVFI